MDGTVPRSRGRLGITSIASLFLSGLQLVSAIVILGLVGVRFNRASFSSAVSARSLCFQSGESSLGSVDVP